MNCTKFIPPLQIFVDFYYYYSFFTLFLSMLITPPQLCIILTKSKSLKNFKWLILNNAFWNLTSEVFFAIAKPFYLAPAIGGFPLGLLKNGNRITTILGMCAMSFIFLMQVSALAVTLVNRYLFVFPSKLIEYVNKKLIFGLFVLFSGISSTGFFYTLYPYLFVTTFEAHQAALEYDPCLSMYFGEPAFVFFALSKTTLFLIFLVFLFGCFVLIVGSFLLSFFIYRVYFHEAASIIKLQKSLITSIIIQVFISLIFLCLPIFGFVLIISFQISNIFVSNLCQIGCCAISTHSTLESLATLYFVAPYRKAIKGYLAQYVPYFRKIIPAPIVFQISATSNGKCESIPTEN